MKKFKNPKFILFGTCFTLLLAISGIWAYFSATGMIENVFRTGNSQLSIIEVFDPADQWLPGEQKQKEVRFKNSGSTKMLLRFRVEQALYQPNGTEVTPIPKDMFTIGWDQSYLGMNFTEGPGTTIVDGEDRNYTYYYYNKILDRNDETLPVINYVEFADWISNGNGKPAEDYQNYKASVKIIGEMVQLSEGGTAARENGWVGYTEDPATGSVIWNVSGTGN
ncbi:MAG: hypothetical protein HFG75_16485 [Hungatella sp.]|nr:hypothetical protein [Hungatella sp.]